MNLPIVWVCLLTWFSKSFTLGWRPSRWAATRFLFYGYRQQPLPLAAHQRDTHPAGNSSVEFAKLATQQVPCGQQKMDTEKRRYPRFECTGTGGIHITSEPPYFARVANLSLAGCLMVLQQPRPLPLDMMVELTFEVNRLPFRVRAQVKAVRSDKMIGFQFLQLSRRTQWQLEELIEELAEPIPAHPALTKTRLS